MAGRFFVVIIYEYATEPNLYSRKEYRVVLNPSLHSEGKSA